MSQTKIVYNITWYEKSERIDSTQIDEINEELIWDLFAEFGHVKTPDTTYQITEEWEEEE